MPPAFSDVAVLRKGDPQGNRMVLRLTTHGGTTVHAVGVPQDWPSRTGPTWAYLFESDGATLVDPGSHGTFQELADGLKLCGYSVKDVDRVIVSHGHSDHDGSIAEMVDASDAELWTHGMYAALLPYDQWEVQDRSASPIHTEMNALADAAIDKREESTYRVRNKRYKESKKGLSVDHTVANGETFGDATVIHAPGHSPDELCLTFDGVVFTGDHVLPEITPHPTTKATFRKHIQEIIPNEFEDASKSYGLETYMRSLKTVIDLGPTYSILPAHRLYNRNRYNFQTVERAREIVRHHARRLNQILQRLTDDDPGLESVTRGIFEHGKLLGGNLYMALAEMVAHIELLEDLGDVEFTEDKQLRKTGSQHYRQFVAELLD
ncbi:MAG: MBL fold metallo-hydrolase [SAR202 cluster bacterium]|nr:MBL fold metallo-hydrolase [SAR202 cluster bacterium]MDP6301476.1 MBL fold metallo-hydrolase [SAR202 cluster bacterium]MDP7104988.1 MBL fold metallo-hydrolase [SAR202 cluster bacterium]MDP7226387.1 MBL fold metallo-hydrolase [SAR202 cluster bacterium]MDP7414276.1 MBL fold metallo-hydrolase [SAR202 cluster bacterium]